MVRAEYPNAEEAQCFGDGVGRFDTGHGRKLSGRWDRTTFACCGVGTTQQTKAESLYASDSRLIRSLWHLREQNEVLLDEVSFDLMDRDAFIRVPGCGELDPLGDRNPVAVHGHRAKVLEGEPVFFEV